MPVTIGKGLIGIAVAALSFWLTLVFLGPGPSQTSAVESTRPNAPMEGLPPSWKDWNEALYLAVNPDVAAAVAKKVYKSGRQHYEVAGMNEHRLGASIPRDWDEADYLKTNGDVANAVKVGNFISGYHHWLAAGRVEKRRGGFPPGRVSEK